MAKPIIIPRKITPQELRDQLTRAVLAGHNRTVVSICEAANDTTLQEALFKPTSLHDSLKPQATKAAQTEALWEVSAAEGGVRQRLRDASISRNELLRRQKRDFQSVIAHWLTVEELSDPSLCNECFTRLARYRDHNPPHLIDKRSFVEMLAEAEEKHQPYKTVLKDLADEWADDEGKFTVKRLAKFLLKDMEHTGITPDQAEEWLKDPGENPLYRDKVTELACLKFSMTSANEAMLWRVARGDKNAEISEATPPAKLYEALKARSGIPQIRFLPMTGIHNDVDSEVSRDFDRSLTMERAQEVVEVAMPSKHWLTQRPDEEKAKGNWRLAQRMTRAKQTRSMEDIILQAMESAEPHKFLTDAIVGKDGIAPRNGEEMLQLWKQADSTLDYGVDGATRLKQQAEQARTFSLSEANVIIALARHAYPYMTESEETACREILTRCPAPEILIDRYLQQVDDKGQPAAIKLKETIERIAAREGKQLTAQTEHKKFIPEISTAVCKILREEDRIAGRSAPLFADRIGLEGERRRHFLLKAQGIAIREPMDVLDETLGGTLSAPNGLRALIEQTGLLASSFAEKHGYTARAMQIWCERGASTDPDMPKHLAHDLCRPEMADLLSKTFFHKPREAGQFDKAVAERTNFHQSRVVTQALRLGQNNDLNR